MKAEAAGWFHPGFAALPPTGHAQLDRLLHAVVNAWPEHGRFLRHSLAGYDATDLVMIEDLARRVGRIADGEIDAFIQSYRWMCGEMNKESLHFKKHGGYRLSSFAQADAAVYANRAFMRRYMQGLLVSQVLWRNHSAACLFFRKSFLTKLNQPFRYLEIGPGHGLFLSMAAECHACACAEGWDVSAESLRQTADALAALGVSDRVELRREDVCAPTRSPGQDTLYDGIAICEVLEHLERPLDALVSLRRFLSADGVVFVNVPINSPAPDHIFLLRNADEVRALIEGAGLTVLDLRLVPMTGYSLAEAVRQNATITSLVLAR